MEIWVLLFTAYTMHSPGVSSAEFTTEQRCVDAAKAFEKSWGYKVYYSCTRK